MVGPQFDEIRRRQAQKKEADKAAEKQGVDHWQKLMKDKAAVPKMITEHVVEAGETLSHLALKYYGNAGKPYYMVIYEANKELIGKNPNKIIVGWKLKIPELPEELKKE